MATIVGGFLMPHDPLMTMIPNAPQADKAARVRNAFEAIVVRLRELKVDTVITIGDDHYRMFGPTCIPQCLIAIGDVEGPLESDLGFERSPISNNEPLAMHILKTGYRDGIHWAFSKTIVVDHATAVPHHLCYRRIPGLRTIPVYLNDGVPPYIRNESAAEIGRSIAHAVETWSPNERVAVFGTGGCSHWVGSAEMGCVNEDFDRRLAEMVRQGDLAGLMALRDEDVLAEAGNGALEYKNWICAMTAVRSSGAEIIAYEPVPEWISGICFAQVAPS